MTSKKFKSNKATFEIKGNKINKKYFKTGDSQAEYELLLAIKKRFTPKYVDDWTYRPIKVYSAGNDETIIMEYIPAKTIKDHFRGQANPSYYKHMGIWLGFLHVQSINREYNTVLSFEDYSDSNFLLDFKNKVGVAIDPGISDSLYEHPSISLITGLFSIQRTVLKESKNYFIVLKAAKFFLKGYKKSSKTLDFPDIKRGVKALSKRKKVLWYKNRGRHLPIYKKIGRTIEVVSVAILFKVISMSIS